MRELPVNLATLPYEHARRVRRALIVVAVIVVLLSALHTGVVVQLFAGKAPVSDSRAPAEQRSFVETVQDWRQESEQLAAAADPTRTRDLANAVTLANGLISWHTLPWEPLFAALERALPDDVRLELVRPSSEEDAVRIELVAAASSRAALGSLLTSLEQEPLLSAIVPTLEERGDDGRYRMTIRVAYRGPGNHADGSP